MFSIEIKLLNDYSSLIQYERNNCYHGYSMPFDEIKRRLTAIERTSEIVLNDNFYDDKSKIHLSGYKSLDQFLIEMPQNIAQQMLCSEGNTIFIKKEKLNEWMDILTYMPPSFFIAGYVYMQLDGRLPKTIFDFQQLLIKHLNQFKYTAQPIAYLPEINALTSDRGLSDLHIHLNGTTESEIIWMYMLKHPYRTINDFFKEYTHKIAVRKFVEQISPDLTPELFTNRILDAKELRSILCKEIASTMKSVPPCNKKGSKSNIDLSFGITDIWQISNDGSIITPVLEEILFYLYSFWIINQKPSLTGLFHHYLLIKGIVHKMAVMQITQFGFSQFQLITETSSRYGAEEFYKNRFLQLAGASKDKFLGNIEGRFSPGLNCYKNNYLIHRIFDGFAQAKDESKDGLLDGASLQLVAHFIKKEDKRHDIAIRHRELRSELEKKAFALIHFIKTNPSYAEKIVGIDAAGSEFYAGPEVFAPTFNFIRENGISRCTYHAGEDFKHIISGIRSIYEAVLFLDLSHGDRLGHCTAIGIDPTLWMHRTKDLCIISQGEWLDNLVFVWFIIKESIDLELQKHLNQIENRIAEYSYKVYHKIYPPYVLSEAWKLRKYDPFIYVEKSRRTLKHNLSSIKNNKDVEIMECFQDEDIIHIMKIYHRMTKEKGNEYDKLIEIKSSSILDCESIRKLQNQILLLLKNKGIIIETLPTSNLRIGYYKDMKEYHLHRWLNSENREFSPAIVMGTDDAGIFTTNIFNEYARVFLHLEQNNVSSRDIYEELWYIHKNSEIFKFKNHEQ